MKVNSSWWIRMQVTKDLDDRKVLLKQTTVELAASTCVS